jgi:hypothetical protein
LRGSRRSLTRWPADLQIHCQPVTPVKAAGTHRAQRTRNGAVELRHEPLTSCMLLTSQLFIREHAFTRSLMSLLLNTQIA